MSFTVPEIVCVVWLFGVVTGVAVSLVSMTLEPRSKGKHARKKAKRK